MVLVSGVLYSMQEERWVFCMQEERWVSNFLPCVLLKILSVSRNSKTWSGIPVWRDGGRC